MPNLTYTKIFDNILFAGGIMQKFVPPHDLVLFKIIKEFEEKNKVVHTKKGLMDFALKSMKEAEKISGQKYCLYFSGQEYDRFFNERLKEFCDFTSEHIILNKDKYYSKPYLLQERLSSLQGDLREGATSVLNQQMNKDVINEK